MRTVLASGVLWVRQALTAPLQLYLLNSTLASSPVSYAVPLYQALLIMLTAAAGGIFFREFAHISAQNGALFLLGVATAMGGLAMLSPRGGESARRAGYTSPEGKGAHTQPLCHEAGATLEFSVRSVDHDAN
jgi:multidrug transporter EmrE-like cation transporter